MKFYLVRVTDSYGDVLYDAPHGNRLEDITIDKARMLDLAECYRNIALKFFPITEQWTVQIFEVNAPNLYLTPFERTSDDD